MSDFDKTDLTYKVRRVQAMINERDEQALDEMYQWMDNAYRSFWELPKEITEEDIDWIHRVTSTDPHDAVRTGARALSTFMPDVKMYPLRDNKESREVTSEIERALKWQFTQACNRRDVNLLHDIVLSALLYDEVIISVWYLPEQIKILKKWGVDPGRVRHAQRYGDYIIKVHNPRDTIVEYSDLFAERAVFKSVVPVQEVIDYWGERADGVKEMREQDQYEDYDYMALYDYSEVGGHRAVFGYLTRDTLFTEDHLGEDPIEILNEKTKYSFLPISAKIGGTSLATEGRYQRVPLLWSVYNSGQWETQNFVETMVVSEGLAYSVSPRYAIENEYDNDEPDIDFREPARIVNLKRGQALRDLRPPALNEGLLALSSRLSERMDKSTVPRFLQAGEASGSFSSLNLQSQAGMKAIAPYKKLAESALAEMFTIMLYWIKHTGTPLTTYVPKNDVPMRDENNNPRLDITTQKITIGADDSFDEDRIYLEVRLREDTPSDYVAKVNAGGMMVERLRYPYSKALEFIGEADPDSVLALRNMEDKEQARNEAEVQKIINDASFEMERARNELDQAMQQVQEMGAQLQQMMAQLQAGAQGQGGPDQMPVDPNNPLAPSPDGSVNPQAQMALSASDQGLPPAPAGLPNPPGMPGGPPMQGPQIPSNPAEGDIPPIQGAPGVGLREEVQGMEGE